MSSCITDWLLLEGWVYSTQRTLTQTAKREEEVMYNRRLMRYLSIFHSMGWLMSVPRHAVQILSLFSLDEIALW